MDLYGKFIGEGDPRMNDLLFIKTPTPVLLITLIYLVVVRLGPQIMENYKPLKLKAVLLIYNLFLVLLSVYMFKEMAHTTWWFFFSKALELLDTVFIILRKKSDQISFLHVYHHSTMLCLCWTGVKYFPGGEAVIVVLLNSFVHIFMYAYYGLSILGERVKPYLWWKRYLTQLQLGQFLLGTAHILISVYYNCQFPKFMSYAVGMYLCTLIVLFLNFYIKTYIRKRYGREKMQKPIKAE